MISSEAIDSNQDQRAILHCIRFQSKDALAPVILLRMKGHVTFSNVAEIPQSLFDNPFLCLIEFDGIVPGYLAQDKSEQGFEIVKSSRHPLLRLEAYLLRQIQCSI